MPKLDGHVGSGVTSAPQTYAVAAAQEKVIEAMGQLDCHGILQSEACKQGSCLRRPTVKSDGGVIVEEDPTMDGVAADLAAVLSAKACMEEAVQELKTSIGKVQANLSGATDVLRSASRADRRASVTKMPRDDSYQLRSASPGDRRALVTNKPRDETCQLAIGIVDVSQSSAKPYAATCPGPGEGPECQANAETLPESWPSSLAIRWEEYSIAHDAGVGLRRSSTKKTTLELGETLGAQRPAKKPCFVIHPNSVGRMSFDLLGASLLAYDAVVIPWMVAWDVESKGVLFYMAWSTACFWTLDIGMSFITAFHHGDEFVFQPHRIVLNYLRCWFVPDIIIVLCDWFSLIVASDPGWRALRIAKFGRLLRLLALFRLLKLFHVISEVMEELLSDFAKLTVRFAKMIFITLMYAHAIACVWFFIGRSGPSDTGKSWISENDIDQDGMWYQYTTSFHWAISQISLGAMEVASTTLLERIYSVVCLVIGLLFGSTLVSTLSATMLEMQMDKRESYLKMQQMRRYLKQSKVDRMLAQQVERQLAERLVARDKIKEDQVVGLSLLSSSMRSQLRMYLFAPYLKRHSLFYLWISMDGSFVERFCRKCMSFSYLRSQDELFVAGKEADHAYFLVDGSMTFTQEPESSPVTETTVQPVEQDRWIAEAALWSRWIHVGTVHVRRNSEVAEMHVARMHEAFKQTSPIVQLTADYCTKFHRRLQAARPPTSSWPDDLKVPLTEWGDMVLLMDLESQITIGLQSIQQVTLGRRWRKAASGLEQLTEEVKAGKSTVMLNSDGEMERVVSVVALKIYNQQEQILIQIGKQESGKMKSACQFPGGKPDRGEFATDTVERILTSKMTPIADSVRVTKIDQEVQWKESKEYGVRSKYLKSIVRSQLEDEDSLEGSKLLEIQLDESEPRTPQSPQLAGGPLEIDPDLERQTNKASQSCAESECWHLLCQKSVFQIQDKKGGCALFAWLGEEEFDQLKAPAYEEVLAKWVAALDGLRPEKEPTSRLRPEEKPAPTEIPEANPCSEEIWSSLRPEHLFVN